MGFRDYSQRSPAPAPRPNIPVPIILIILAAVWCLFSSAFTLDSIIMLGMDKPIARKNIHANKESFMILFVAFESVIAICKKLHAPDLDGVNGVFGSRSGSNSKEFSCCLFELGSFVTYSLLNPFWAQFSDPEIQYLCDDRFFL